jgi:hypothetical protein
MFVAVTGDNLVSARGAPFNITPWYVKLTLLRPTVMARLVVGAPSVRLLTITDARELASDYIRGDLLCLLELGWPKGRDFHSSEFHEFSLPGQLLRVGLVGSRSEHLAQD